MTDNAGYRPTDDSALRWEDCHCTKCGQPDKKCECVALTPGTKPTVSSKTMAERIAERVVLEVCELPDYNSPEDQPDLVMCTVQELNACVLRAFEQLEYDREMERGPTAHETLSDAPFLQDRATGVPGVYCIARVVNGTSEYWTGKEWAAFCGDLYFDLRRSQKAVDQRSIDANALADAHRMYEAEHGHPFSESEGSVDG